MLFDQGQSEEALLQLQEAVRLQPLLTDHHVNLGNILFSLDRYTEARTAYLQALKLDSHSARTYAKIGLTLKKEGLCSDALVWLKYAVELGPTDPVVWWGLGELHFDREEWSEALLCAEQIIALKPNLPEVHDALAWAGGFLQHVGRIADAREIFKDLVELIPKSPLPHMRLSGIHWDFGEFYEAELEIRAALRLNPKHPFAYARLATLLGAMLPPADQEALEELLLNRDMDSEARKQLLFGLGHVLDGRGDYDRAGKCLREAHILSLKLAGNRRREYSLRMNKRFVDWVLWAFTEEFFERMAGAGLETHRPVFVFGLPRSGTTLIEQILSSHSQVLGGGELRYSSESFEAIRQAASDQETACTCASIANLARAHARRVGEEHLQKLHALDGGKAARVVDKMPDNYIFLGVLAVLFPRATFIHCRRDLRDVAVSCWANDFLHIQWTHKAKHVLARFRDHKRLMDHWHRVLRVPIHNVDYEDVVADPKGASERLLATCGLEWDRACMEFYRTKRSVQTASAIQVRQPIYGSSVGRWKHYQNVLGGLFAQLTD
jgi:tetratricopeptide (TPR) repeat protein